jgi:phosphoglucomutase/phosphopentomutase
MRKCCGAMKIRRFLARNFLKKLFWPLFLRVDCRQSRDASIKPLCMVCSQKLKFLWPNTRLRSVLRIQWVVVAGQSLRGHWSLVTGHWSLITAHWSLITDHCSYRSRSSVTKRGLSGLFSGCVLQNPPKVGWVLPLAYPRSWVVLVWRTGPSFRRYSGFRRFSKLAYCLIVYIKKWIKSPHSWKYWYSLPYTYYYS